MEIEDSFFLKWNMLEHIIALVLLFLSKKTKNKNTGLRTWVKIACMQISSLRKSYIKTVVNVLTKMWNPRMELDISLKKPRTIQICFLVILHPQSFNYLLKNSSLTSLMCLMTLAYSLPVFLVSCHVLFAFFSFFLLFSVLWLLLQAVKKSAKFSS